MANKTQPAIYLRSGNAYHYLVQFLMFLSVLHTSSELRREPYDAGSFCMYILTLLSGFASGLHSKFVLTEPRHYPA